MDASSSLGSDIECIPLNPKTVFIFELEKILLTSLNSAPPIKAREFTLLTWPYDARWIPNPPIRFKPWTDPKNIRRVVNYMGALRGNKNPKVISFRKEVKKRWDAY